jgi:hypothetical protein
VCTTRSQSKIDDWQRIENQFLKKNPARAKKERKERKQRFQNRWEDPLDNVVTT